jgi:hypothetical protein
VSALVIKEWKSGTKPIDAQNNFVRITGREGGLIAWLLSLMRIDPTTTIVVGLDRLEFTSASLAGTASRLIPLQSICSTYYGYHKPWKAAASIMSVFGMFAFVLASGAANKGEVGGAITSFLVTGGIGVVLAMLYYFLNRTLTLGFVEQSGVVSGIQFKRSVIENVDVNQEQAKTVCAIVQRLIEAKEKRMQGPAKA